MCMTCRLRRQGALLPAELRGFLGIEAVRVAA